MDDKITYEIFTRVDSIVELLESFKNPSRSSPYQRVEYVKLSLRKHFLYSLLRFVRPFFLRFNINGEAAVIMPLSRSIFGSSYYLFGDRAGSGYLDVIHRNDLSPSDVKACFELLIKEFPNSVFYFNRIRNGSQTFSILSEISTSSGSEECVALELSSDYESYYHSLSKNARQNFRKSNNRISKDSKEVSFLQLNGKDVSRDILDAMIALYIKRLEKRYNRGLRFINTLFYKHFDIGFIAMRQLDFSEVFLIYIGDKLAGFMYCLVDGDELIVPRLAIDDSFSFYSPGVLLVISTIRELYLAGVIKNFDLMQGQEGYKFQVGGKVHECYSFELSKKSLCRLAA